MCVKAHFLHQVKVNLSQFDFGTVYLEFTRKAKDAQGRLLQTNSCNMQQIYMLANPSVTCSYSLTILLEILDL